MPIDFSQFKKKKPIVNADLELQPNQVPIIPTTTEQVFPLQHEPVKVKRERSSEPSKNTQKLQELDTEIQELKRQLQLLQTTIHQSTGNHTFSLVQVLQALTTTTDESESVVYLRKKLILDGEEPLGTGRHQAWLVARKVALTLIDFMNSQR